MAHLVGVHSYSEDGVHEDLGPYHGLETARRAVAVRMIGDVREVYIAYPYGPPWREFFIAQPANRVLDRRIARAINEFDRKWLVFSSIPHGYRDEARAELIAALIRAVSEPSF